MNAVPSELRRNGNVINVDSNRDGVWDTMEADSNLNVVATQGRVARGLEVELVANPTRDWRAILNVSRQQTVNSHTAALLQQAFESYTASMRKDRWAELRESAAGTGSPNRPILENWLASNVAPVRAAAALDGTVSNEQREWRVTGVTSYTFRQERLNGLRLGGSVRWESALTTGYLTALDSDTGVPVPVVDHPYKTGPLLHGDVFASYKRKLGSRIGWKIQLNIRNAFGNDSDIPVKTNPDGMVAVIRIPNARTFTVTNTFAF